MKDYLVTMDSGDWDNIFVVSASNSKEAINQVFENIYKPQNERLRSENKELGYYAFHIYTKSDLTAKSIEDLHNTQGKIIKVN